MEELLADVEAGAYGEPKTVYLPHLEGDTFRALPVSDLDLLEEGEFGLPQAPHIEGDFDMRIDLVLVPGVAFTKKGDRLGMGKGYYDRYLEGVCNLPKLGIAFSEQILETLPVEPHDQGLDGVLTDSHK
jgi:5-formyltetrahydrofolate cyclo-ligase